jgi:ribosomal protein S18 acetylase RimI-like enzyme
MPSIKIVADLSESIEKIMAADLELYEKKHGVTVNYRQFSLVLSLDNNEPVGVLTAYTAFSEIYIDDIWVDSKHRREGLGKMLMDYLENHFKDKGFNNINLVTSQFQAPEFYLKCGYELEFVRKNLINPKFTKYFYIKYFDNIKQTQGLI